MDIVLGAIVLAALYCVCRFVYQLTKPAKGTEIGLAKRLGEVSQQLEEQKKNNLNLFEQLKATAAAYQAEVDNNAKILSQKKSSETRVGQITENIVPFLDAFPFNPKDAHFLGQPIDFIVFDFDEGAITFVEVKTGNAKESQRQKLVKNMVKNGRVFYTKIQVNEKGIKVTEAQNNE